METSEKPLSGIKVLEFEAYPPLTFCSLMLKEHGAEVIKVGNERVTYVVDKLSRGKLSVVVDLKKKEGERSLQDIRDMVNKVDVILGRFKKNVD
jgi:crotonobetainyl-CoA:carnitine CoA-transferase CaiB-like acyl-CoA transferase